MVRIKVIQPIMEMKILPRGLLCFNEMETTERIVVKKVGNIEALLEILTDLDRFNEYDAGETLYAYYIIPSKDKNNFYIKLIFNE